MTFVAYTTGTSNGATSTTFTSPSVSGTHTIGIVGVLDSITDSVTGVKWDSAGANLTMVKIGSTQSDGASTDFISLWYVFAPTTGATSIKISRSGSTGTLLGQALCYSSVKQSAQPDANTTNYSASSSSLSTSVTVVADKSWTVLFARSPLQAMAAGTGTTLRSATGTVVIGDSNAALTAGSQSMVVTLTAAEVYSIMASFAPFTDSSSLTDTVVTTDTINGTITSSYIDTVTTSETITTRKNGPQNNSKNSATFTDTSKNNASPSNTSKSSTTWSDLTKN